MLYENRSGEVFKLFRAGETKWFTEESMWELDKEIKTARALGEDHRILYFFITTRGLVDDVCR